MMGYLARTAAQTRFQPVYLAPFPLQSHLNSPRQLRLDQAKRGEKCKREKYHLKKERKEKKILLTSEETI